MYRMLDEEGLFLPSIKYRAITCNYMMKVFKKEVFRVKIAIIKNPPRERKTMSNIDLLAFIEGKAYPVPLGIGPNNLPDRKWLLTIAYSYDHRLQIFTGLNEDEEIV